MNIQNNLDKLRNQISKNVNIVAVSKTQSTDKILEAYNYGLKEFGENGNFLIKIEKKDTNPEFIPNLKKSINEK